MEQGRSGDLVLAQGTYVHILEGATGQVGVISGPNKTSLQKLSLRILNPKKVGCLQPVAEWMKF
jgi:hypothetical protein